MDRLSYVQIDAKRRLCFGLDWTALDDLISKHEQILAWKARGYAWAAVFAHKKLTQYALAMPEYGIEGAEKRGQTISGAALLAGLRGVRGGTGLYLLVSDANVFAIAIVRGHVIFDRVLAESDVTSARQEFADECAKADVPPVFVGTQGFESVTGPLDSWLAWDALRAAKRGFKSAQLNALKSDRYDWVIATVAALSLAGIAGAWFWKDYADKEQVRKLQAAIFERDPVNIYTRAIEKFKSNGSAIAPLDSAMRALIAKLEGLEVHRSGWQLQTVTCDVDSGRCISVWAPDSSRIGSFAQFKQAAPADWTVHLGPAMDRLEAVMSADIVRSRPMPIEMLPTAQEFMESSLSAWQPFGPLGLGVIVKSPVAQQVPGGVPMHVAQNFAGALLAVPWSVTGAPWWATEVLLGSPANMTLDTLTLSFTGVDLKFSAEGKAYVRK